MNNIYTGIGSRNTPNDILRNMEFLGYFLSTKNYVLRSGHAKGADIAFESGCDRGKGKKEIYLPWKGFEGSDSELFTISDDAFKSVDLFHPSPSRLSTAAKKLIARDYMQVLGLNNTPSDFVVCWTSTGRASGETGQAIRIAEANNIPVFNLYNENSIKDLTELLKSIFKK